MVSFIPELAQVADDQMEDYVVPGKGVYVDHEVGLELDGTGFQVHSTPLLRVLHLCLFRKFIVMKS